MCPALFWVGTIGKAMNMREKSLTYCCLQSSKKRQKNVICNVISRDECSGVRRRVSGVGAILYKRPEVDEEASQADIKGKCLKQKKQKAQRS